MCTVCEQNSSKAKARQWRSDYVDDGAVPRTHPHGLGALPCGHTVTLKFRSRSIFFSCLHTRYTWIKYENRFCPEVAISLII